MTAPPEPPLRRAPPSWPAILLGVLGLSAALALLVLAMRWAPWSPEPDSFRTLLREPPAGHLPEALFDFAHQPNFLVARAAHQAVLWLPGNDFGSPVSIVCIWLVALACAVLALRSLRSDLGGRPVPAAVIWCGIGLLGLHCFHPGFGMTWLVTERLRVLLPAWWLLLGATALLGSHGGWRKGGERMAALCAGAGAFTSAAGAAVWIALLPLAWCCRRRVGRAAARRALLTIAAAGSCSMWLALDEVPSTPNIPPGETGLVAAWDQPADYASHLVYRLGLALPDVVPGSLNDRTVLGAAFALGWVFVLVGAAVVTWRNTRRGATIRGDRSRLDGASLPLGDPCLAVWSFGVLATVVESTVHFPAANQFVDELLWSTALGWVGALGYFVRRGKSPRSAPRWAGGMGWVTALLVLPAVQSWVGGLPRLSLESALLKQRVALAGELPGHEVTLPANAEPVLESARVRKRLQAANRLRSTVDLRAAALAESMAAAAGRPTIGEIQRIDPRGTQLIGEVYSVAAASIDAVVVTLEPPDAPARLLAIVAPNRIGVAGSLTWATGLTPPTRAPGTRIRAFGLRLLPQAGDRAPRLLPLDRGVRANEDGQFSVNPAGGKR